MSVTSKESSRRSSRPRQRKRGGLSTEAKALIYIGLGLAFVAALFFVIIRPSMSATPRAGQAQIAELLIREDSMRWGPADARVTLVEFLDYECPSCAAMHPTVERLRKEYGDRLQFVVRYFPLHGNSVLASKAAEAAGRQGQYEAMASMLFEQQRAWGGKSTPQTDIFIEFARRIGLDIEQFRRELADTALDAKVRRDEADAVAAGVTGTPTFFVNGVQVGSGMTYEQLKSRLDAALR